MSWNDAFNSRTPQTAEAVEVELTEADLPVEGRDFERGTWAGLDRFQCLHCPWDTTYPERIITHYISRHKPVPPPVDRPTDVLLFDGNGQKIDRVPIVGKHR